MWELLLNIINLTNKLTQSDGEMSSVVNLLAPRIGGIKNRLRVASDFSFAVCDMLGISYVDRQLLLESPTLARRLKHLKSLLSTARDYLLEYEKGLGAVK